MERSLFPAASVVTDWEWDGSLECEEIVLTISEQPNCIPVEDDRESIIFRTMKLRKAKDPPPPKPVKKLVVTLAADTTFLTAPIHKMGMTELKRTLKGLGMQTTGTKAELRARLQRLIGREDK